MRGDPKMWQLAGRFAGLGGEMALPPLACAWLGGLIDQRWHCAPWGLRLGLGLGCAAALRAVLRQVVAMRRHVRQRPP